MPRLFLVAMFLVLAGCSSETTTVLETDGLRMAIGADGHVTALVDRAGGRDVLADGQPAPLLQLRVDGRMMAPEALVVEGDSAWILRFPGEDGPLAARIRAEARGRYLRLELLSVEPEGLADRLLWGPFPTTIGETVGEIVGVVRDGVVAVGIQALNTKTIGGMPENEEGAVYPRGTTALATDFGSTLQAFSLDRSRPRAITVWSPNPEVDRLPNMPVPPLPGETLAGSAIGLFACPPSDVLDTIEAVELGEGLPHPLIDGVWAKRSPDTGRPYLITPFTESNIDSLLDAAEQGGFNAVYHPGPFRTWGHFALDEDAFPNGRAGLRAVVDKGKARGIRVGVHTLTDFITTNDPYVSPVPDPRLAKAGIAELTADIDAHAREIPVSDPAPFANDTFNALRSAAIGEEIVRCGRVSEDEPVRLLDCERGAFGTRAAAHAAGAEVGKLVDHPYLTFYPYFDLMQEIAHNLADLLNETGAAQIDFDGHEGAYSTGQGDYAMAEFARIIYDEVDHTVVNGSSRSHHYYWHIVHYLNWGEPWYAGFRESQQTYRFQNQPLLERNYLPNMLGWFLLRPSTTVDDIDWLMARAAGYDAGFALVADLDDLRANPHTETILPLIRTWDEARRRGAFSDSLRAALRDLDREFHLETTPDGDLQLIPSAVTFFSHEARTLQPGEPTYSAFTFENPFEDQPVRLTLQVKGENAGAARSISLSLDGGPEMQLPEALEPGQRLVYDGGDAWRWFDDNQRLLGAIPIDAPPTWRAGANTIRLDADLPEGTQLSLECKSRGPAIDVAGE